VTPTLFHDLENPSQQTIALATGVTMLKGFALVDAELLLEQVREIAAISPFRHMVTPGGFTMSVGLTNCGRLGWVTDRSGYRYDPVDPATGRAWPSMPAVFERLARNAAGEAGFANFTPDACLVNRYEPEARLTLHQDKNERDYDAPIVSVSLGLPARFLLGGLKRSDRTKSVPLIHGDVLVWGGPSRLRFHGVAPIREGHHPATGSYRINLTFRRAE
jgi:alkylated DNA repair protein (DNA oxidative demethylase)